MAVSGIDLGKYKLGWHDSTDDYAYTPKKGLNEDVVSEISHQKSEPDWMTKFRLNALKRFEKNYIWKNNRKRRKISVRETPTLLLILTFCYYSL